MLSVSNVVIDLAESKNATVNAMILPADADQSVEWASSDKSVATVSRGKITGRSIGTAQIIARSDENPATSAVCNVSVIDSDVPSGVQLNYSALTLDLASSSASKAQLIAQALPAGANQKIKWSTSSSSVVRISSEGVVTGRKVGTAVIKAVSAESSKIYAECIVNVIDSRIPTSITLQGMGASLSMERYQTLQLAAVTQPATADPTLVWKSSKSSVVSVSKNGLLTAKKGGTALITCYSKRSKAIAATLQVTVLQYPTPTDITLSPSTSVMVVGDTLAFTPVTTPSSGVCDYFTWKSSSASRASVSAEGIVTAKKTGWVTITCTSKQSSRVKESRKILIVSPTSPHAIQLTDKATGQTVNGQTLTVHPADEIELLSTVVPAGKNPYVKWKSSRTSVATVDENGKVLAKRAGTATITATSVANKEVVATVTLKVVNLPAPDAIMLSAPASTVEMSDSPIQLNVTTYPLGEKRSKDFKWKSSSSSIARVSDTGVVTLRKLGTVTIACTSRQNSRVKATFTLKVIDTKLPDSVTLDQSGTITIENGQQLKLNASVLPETATQTLTWKSSSPSRVYVDQNGIVTGVKSGSATITATSTYSSSRKDSVKIKVVSKSAPASLALQASPAAIMAGESTLLIPVPTPASASVLGTYTSSNPAVATVDDSGMVRAHSVGSAVITLKSVKNPAVSASITIVVYDENTPGRITLNKNTLYTAMDHNEKLIASVYPATAPQTVTWTSSNDSIVSVSNGVLTPKGVGTAVITATTSNGLSAKCRVSVTSSYVSTVIPDRTTNISGIPANLKKIADIEHSAKNQIAILAMEGKISESESTARQQIIERAFDMQAFPWMTESKQDYWNWRYPEKSYLPGKVYYGLPYIQNGLTGEDENREYNVDKALKEGRYVSSGNGYYLLNRKNLLDKMYVGCDCSAFVNMAEYGINHPTAFLKTYTMDTSSYYRTLSSYSEMRPGDFLVLRKSHTVMFLYWVDAAKTKMMIIEQGGDGNTVICSIHDTSYYSSQNYIARRRTDFKR